MAGLFLSFHGSIFTGIITFTTLATTVIVNSRFLQRPQKRSHGNQLIDRGLSKTKSISSGSDPESQADSQTAMVDGVWSRDGRKVGRRVSHDKSSRPMFRPSN